MFAPIGLPAGRRRMCTRILGGVCALALLAASPAGAARLARDVVPTRQTVRLTLDPRRADYHGRTEATLRVASGASSFQLHARDLTVTRVTLSGASGPIEAAFAAAPGERVTITPASPLGPGDYTVTLEFTNRFNTLAVSLYRLETGGESYAFTQFEADEARGAFPCWDEPDFKIPWQVTLVVPKSDLAVSNTPIEREVAEGDTKVVTFRATPPMPSYLVALAAGPLDTVAIPGLRFPGRVVTVKGGTGRAGEAARMTAPLVAELERFYDQPYPYEKLDLLALPEFIYGAMENPGAITFTDRRILLEPGAVSPQQRQALASTLAHELAHMWFGDYVTMAWWNDLWLNESFASWLGDRMAQRVFPEFDMDVDEMEGAARAFTSDARPSTRAIRQPITDDVNLDQLADELAYNKGQMVLGMFEQWLGPETFRLGIVDYLRTHAWKNASADDLWAALGRASGRDAGAVMATFLDQPGVPLVSAEVKGRSVTLRQRRLLPPGSPASEQRWSIPVTLRFAGHGMTHTQSVLLTEREQTFPLEPAIAPAWLHPNADERGYYRWSLTPDDLAKLIAAAGTLTVRERVGLLGNLGALLEAGELHADAYLRTLGAFGADPAPQVVSETVRGLGRARLAFATPDLEEPFAKFVRATLRPALARIGFEPAAGEGPPMAKARHEVLIALGDAGADPEVRAWAKGRAAAYLADPRAIAPALADAALRGAALDGDAKLFDAYRRRFETAEAPTERARFLEALGWFHRPAMQARALDYGRDGPLRPHELRLLLRGRATDDASSERTFRWLTEHYDAIAKRMPPEMRAGLPGYAEGCHSGRLEAARAFFDDPAHGVAGTKRTLAKVADRILDCANLRAREGEAAARFLRSGATATAN
jgi:alanyl aminopeptidase